MPRRSNACAGFSLLEVIIATGILATSTVLLLGALSTAERHGRKADRATVAQLLCLAELESLMAEPATIRTREQEPIPGFAEWRCSTAVEELAVDGLLSVTVAVHYVQPTNSNFAGSAANRPATLLAGIDSPPAFELTRLVWRSSTTGLPSADRVTAEATR